jgi:hypothetical protein
MVLGRQGRHGSRVPVFVHQRPLPASEAPGHSSQTTDDVWRIRRPSARASNSPATNLNVNFDGQCRVRSREQPKLLDRHGGSREVVSIGREAMLH